ncbi:MAG: putative sulfate/molybdate transporter [Actinomycetota bacterium]|nr:putative sulfate/molybdate transporter [Actinomycetota bacterium]
MSEPRRVLGDASGALADLGILIPLAATLALRNGLDGGTLLLCAGMLYVAAGLYFRVPVSVQPVKAAAAIAIAHQLDAAVVAAAAVILGSILVLAALAGVTDRLATLFPLPVIRALQLGVGLVLVRTAFDMVALQEPLLVGAVAVTGTALAVVGVRTRWAAPAILALVMGGVVWSLLAGGPIEVGLQPVDIAPADGVFDGRTLWLALTMLVLPQLPLTFGNAVVAVVDLEHRYFGAGAARVSTRSITLSCGLANLLSGCVGGMPLCHGSNGLTAHFRAGARTYRMNLMIGLTLVAAVLLLGGSALLLLSLIPLAVLAALLTFTAVSHGALVADLRGYPLVLAVVAGVAGAAASNLLVTLGIALVAYWVPQLHVARREVLQGA